MAKLMILLAGRFEYGTLVELMLLLGSNPVSRETICSVLPHPVEI